MLTRAALYNADSRKCKVILHGVGWLNLGKIPRYFNGGLQRNVVVIMKPQNFAKPGDMNIDGDNQFRLVNGAPKPGIDVVAADHPAKKEVQPFGCAAVTGACQKKSKSTWHGHPGRVCTGWKPVLRYCLTVSGLSRIRLS